MYFNMVSLHAFCENTGYEVICEINSSDIYMEGIIDFIKRQEDN